MTSIFDRVSGAASLPVAAQAAEVAEVLDTSGVAVVKAPPGTGKTTLIPPLVADRVEGRVVVTQPRRVAARAAARRIASLLGEDLGQSVGYTIKGESRICATTRIEMVTPGVLIRRLQRDPGLAGVGAVILDEVHERHLDSDLALAFVAEARILREELRVVAMSATLSESIAHLLGARVVYVPGVLFPLDVRYVPPPRGAEPLGPYGVTREFLAHVASTIRRAADRTSGDVLAFLPGVREIADVAARLGGSALVTETGALAIEQLHGQISNAAQDRIVRASGGRRIILASAIAESSLTVPGVRCVVDAGLSREQRTDYGRGVGGLVTVRESRASGTQRAGRAGREAPGVVYRCFDEPTWARLAAHPEPEVRTADLANFALELACWGDATLIDEPPTAGMDAARKVLASLGCVDAEGRVTAHGRRIAQMPVDPRIGHALIEASRSLGATRAAHACALVASDERVNDADLLRAWDRVAIADMRRLEGALRDSSPNPQRCPMPMEIGVSGGVSREESLALVTALAYPERVARIREPNSSRYVTAGGLGATLPAGSPLLGQEWLAIAGLDVDGRADAIIRAAVPLGSWEPARSLLTVAHEVEFVDGKLRGWAVESLGAIALARRPEPVDSGAAREWLRDFSWDFSDDAEAFRSRLAFVRSVWGEPWPAVDAEALASRVEEWAGPEIEEFVRGGRIRAVGIDQMRRLLPWPEALRFDELAPDKVELPLGAVRVDYSSGKPRASVRIQEVFGLAETPRISGVPLTLELLSPARRQVAITDDLASFWAGPYAGVRADMRGRYPKHPWPEDPANADPTRRTKPGK